MIEHFVSVAQKRPPLGPELQIALNLIPAHTWYAVPSGALTFVNERAADYLGLPKDHPLRFGTVTGADWDSHIPLLHPDDREETRRVWSDCLRTGCAGEVSFRMGNADGGYRWFLSRAEPVRAADGTLLYWIGVNLDIDERKQSEFYLAEGQRLAHTGSWAFTPTGFEYWSSELFQIHGLDPRSKAPTKEEYLGLVHPEDRAFVEQQIQEILATHRAFDFTKRIVRPDGQIRSVRWVGVPATQGSTLQRFVGTGMDVTEQERLTQDLQRREEYLAEAQRLSHTGSFGWNVSTDEHFWSDETFRIFEFAPSAKVSLQMILGCVHPQDMPSVNVAIAAANRAEGIDLEFRLLMPDGRIKYLHAVGKANTGETGGIEIVGAVMDVTARKQTEVELRRSKAHLADAQKLSRTGSVGMEGSTKRIFWSEEAARIYGYPPGTEPTADLILQRAHPDDVDLVKDALERAAQGGSEFDYEHRLLMPDGSIKILHDLAHSFTDEGGNEEVVGAIMDITERKIAEEAIRRSEAYLAKAQRLSHTGSFGWKPETDEIVWSDETYRVFEYDRSVTPTIDSVVQRVHPQDRAAYQKVIDGASQGATDFEHTYRLLLPDGRIKHVHAVAHGLQDACGNREFIGAVTDITEQRHAEAVIRKQEAELRDVVDTIPAIVWSALPDGSNSYVNSRFVEYCGMRPEEIRGTGWHAATHPDDLERHNAKWLASAATGEPFEDEVRFRRADGQYRWHLQRGIPLRDDAGNIVKWYGVLTDIEDRKRAEDNIREREAELRQMLDFAAELVVVFGPNFRHLYANRAALDYVGVTLDEWRQLTPDRGSVVHPDDRDRAREYDLARRGSAYTWELRLRNADGNYRWFLARFNPVRDDKGQIIRWYVSHTDIDDRKRDEERLRQENVALREEIDETSMFEEIVGTSPALQSVLSRISKVAPSDSTVLISGETGTGKELVARAIHRRSSRGSRAFVSVNCAAIPRDLILSELFGHERGAFTGATQRRVGRFELANGGTIFLDEVGELSPDTQVALLRVLQEREFERVGGSQLIHIDVRVIAATNRDLKAAVANGTFRQDLFYRLNVFPVEIPPLRERKQDIMMLVEYFVQRYAKRAGKNIRSIDKETLGILQSYDWPGNIRELQNIIERSVILSSGEMFSVDESWLSKEIEDKPRTERAIIEAALTETKGRISGPSGAAAKLGIPPSTLDHRIKALKIDKTKFKFR